MFYRFSKFCSKVVVFFLVVSGISNCLRVRNVKYNNTDCILLLQHPCGSKILQSAQQKTKDFLSSLYRFPKFEHQRRSNTKTTTVQQVKSFTPNVVINKKCRVIYTKCNVIYTKYCNGIYTKCNSDHSRSVQPILSNILI